MSIRALAKIQLSIVVSDVVLVRPLSLMFLFIRVAQRSKSVTTTSGGGGGGKQCGFEEAVPALSRLRSASPSGLRLR